MLYNFVFWTAQKVQEHKISVRKIVIIKGWKKIKENSEQKRKYSEVGPIGDKCYSYLEFWMAQ